MPSAKDAEDALATASRVAEWVLQAPEAPAAPRRLGHLGSSVPVDLTVRDPLINHGGPRGGELVIGDSGQRQGEEDVTMISDSC